MIEHLAQRLWLIWSGLFDGWPYADNGLPELMALIAISLIGLIIKRMIEG